VAQDNQVVIDFVGNTDQLQKSLQDVDKQVIKTGKDYETAFAEVNKANQQAEQGTKQLATNLQDLNKTVANGAIKEYSKDLQGAVEKLYEQGKVTEALITKYGTATGALKAMQKELATMAALGQSGTKQFKELAKATAELQDTIGDTRGEIKKLASDTRVFDTLVQGARGMAAGFSLVTGTMAAFGSENENVQKTLLKVQGAMAALQGVQELANIATEKGGIVTQAYGAALTVVEFIQKRFAISSAAAWAAATGGVTLLVAAVGGLIYWLNKAQETEEEIAARKKALSDLRELEDKKEETRIKNRDKAAKNQHEQDLLNAKTEREAISIKISYEEKLQDATKIRVKGIEAAAESVKKSYGEQNAYYIAFKEQILAGDGEIIESQKRINDLKKAASKIDDDNKKAKEQADKAYFDELLKRSDAEWEELKKQRDDRWNKEIKDYKEHIAALAQIKSNNEDRIKFEEDYYNHLAEIQTAFETMSFEDFQEWEKKKREEWKISEDAKLKQLHEIGVAQDKQRAEEEKMEKEAIAAAFSITKDISNALYQIESEKNKEKLDNKLSSLEKAKERELSNALLTSEQKTAIEEKYRRKEAEEKRKAWKADQQAKAEQAIINGFLGFTASLATQGYPAGLITGLLAIANAGVQAGLILSQPVPQFAKGTEYVEQGNAPSGVDTVHARLNIGERVVPTEINKQLAGIKNEDLPKLLQAAYYPPMPHAPEMSGLNAVVVKQDIDYKKLGKVIAEELRANPQTHINIDKGGFSLHVIEKGKKVQSLNNRYES
jgi:hypothetical protein